MTDTMTDARPASTDEPPTPPPPAGPPTAGRPAHKGGKGRGLAIAAAVLVVALVVSFGFGSSSSSDGENASAGSTATSRSVRPDGAAPTTVVPSASGAEDKALADVESGSATSDSVAPPGSPTVGTDTPPAIDPKIIKTSSIELEVRKGAVGATFTRLTSLASGAGGFVSQQQTAETGGSPSGTVTIRVPSAAFEDVLAQARKLGTVTSATTGGQDVTGEYTDTEARLKSLTAERDQLAIVLGSATNVTDILSVRDRMTSVQTEIEQLQGRKNVLDNQVSLATLTVSVHEKGDVVATVPPDAEKTGFSKAWDDAVHGFNSTLQAIVAGSGRTLVLLLIGLVLFGIGRLGLKAARRRWPPTVSA